MKKSEYLKIFPRTGVWENAREIGLPPILQFVDITELAKLTFEKKLRPFARHGFGVRQVEAYQKAVLAGLEFHLVEVQNDAPRGGRAGEFLRLREGMCKPLLAGAREYRAEIVAGKLVGFLRDYLLSDEMLDDGRLDEARAVLDNDPEWAREGGKS